ncbi:MAG: hypothetical protein LBB85_05065 [Dysgonamonadaceae bacterium]|jgi:hypothetical protein|nr:hypothetical protein [Dysgonamonadaceae bacterium]
MANSSNPYQNKQAIRERMRGLAARYLGVSRTELLDPVVNLLLESLSEEVYRIAGTLEAAEDRICDRLTTLLAPDRDAIAQPAHTVLHAAATESVAELTAQTEFRCATNDLNFYPAVNTRLYGGDVRYFIHNEYLYAVDPDQTYNLLTRSGKKDPALSSTFWIGLALDSSVEELENLSFYIDFHGVYNKEKYLNLLSYARWTIQDRELSFAQGIYSIEDKQENDILAFFSAYDVSNRINRQARELYAPHFFTIKNIISLHNKELFPQRLKAIFPEHAQNRLTQPLLWLEVFCPSELSPEILDTIRISINAFPAVNKKLVRKTVEINRILPVVPLSTGNGESFLSVASLSDSRGRQYYDIPVNDTENACYGIYSLFHGGYERYGRREAMEFLSGQVDQISGEASFFFRNQSDVNAGLKKMNGEATLLVRYLDKTLSEVKERYEIENYMLVETESDEETCFLSYWTTQGATANNVPQGTRLQASPEALLLPSSIFTLSAVYGGKQAPQSIEKEHAHKKALSQPVLLITNEDVRNFCLTRFKDTISNVEVKKGIMESADPRTGFIRTVDVYLTFRREAEKYMQDGILFAGALKQYSPETYCYRVFIN